ncbi:MULTISPECIES: hypothetical protein [unclassified Mesorhizobium]|nr:hypothetical protein [Mesorhizobium sp. LSHC420B00]
MNFTTKLPAQADFKKVLLDAIRRRSHAAQGRMLAKLTGAS